MLVIAKASIEKVKELIREITRRNKGWSIESVVAELNKRLPGWVRYFQHAQCKTLLRQLDGWIRRKLRCYRLKQLKRAWTIVKAMIAGGVPEWQAWILAVSGKGWWRRSACPQVQMLWGINWFKQIGLISLEEVYLSCKVK